MTERGEVAGAGRDMSNCKGTCDNKVLFSFEKILDFGTIALSFVCDKYCPIIN